MCIPQSGPMASFGAFLTCLIFCTTGRRKRFNHNQDLKQIFNTLTIFVLSVITVYKLQLITVHANYFLQDNLFAADLSAG